MRFVDQGIPTGLYAFAATAPTGFPQDVSVDSVSSKSAELSWSPPLPEERNGIISGYIITVTRRGTDSQLQIMSTTTNITLNRLIAFTSYLVTVATATSAGLGPPSSQLTFTTDEDGNELNTSSVFSGNAVSSC